MEANFVSRISQPESRRLVKWISLSQELTVYFFQENSVIIFVSMMILLSTKVYQIHTINVYNKLC